MPTTSPAFVRPVPQCPSLYQLQEDPQSLSVADGGIELDACGKQRCLIKALKAFSLAFSRLSRSISLSSCYGFAGLRLHPLLVNNCRHRGKEARDSLWLGGGEGASGEGDVVMGAKQGKQAKKQAVARPDLATTPSGRHVEHPLPTVSPGEETENNSSRDG